MQNYLDLLEDILENGVDVMDRTGVGRRRVFGRQLRFNLRASFPLVTTKKVHWKSVVGELLWMISGSTSATELREQYGVTIWDEWANKYGELGPIYGYQWRSWPLHNEDWDRNYSSTDQLGQVISDIRYNPASSRLLVNAWNVTDLDDMALPPCHFAFQFFVEEGRLSCHMNMRSCDVFLGLPFNIASYALLTHMVAQVTDLEVGELIVTTGDTHLYLNHLDQAREQLKRDPRPLPYLWLDREVADIDDFVPESIQLINYNPHPAIKADVAV